MSVTPTSSVRQQLSVKMQEAGMFTYCQQKCKWGCPIGAAEKAEHSYHRTSEPIPGEPEEFTGKLNANSQNSIIPNSLKVDTTQLMYRQKMWVGHKMEKIFDCKKKKKKKTKYQSEFRKSENMI